MEANTRIVTISVVYEEATLIAMASNIKGQHIAKFQTMQSRPGFHEEIKALAIGFLEAVAERDALIAAHGIQATAK